MPTRPDPKLSRPFIVSPDELPQIMAEYVAATPSLSRTGLSRSEPDHTEPDYSHTDGWHQGYRVGYEAGLRAQRPDAAPAVVDERAGVERLTTPTRRIERPRLESRPLPPRWEMDERIIWHAAEHFPYAFDAEVTIETAIVDPAQTTDDELREIESYALDLVELARWARHERAVRAQGGAS